MSRSRNRSGRDTAPGRTRRLGGVLLLAGLACTPALADLRQARQQIAADDLAAARRTLERDLQAAPQNAEARFLLARVLAWQGRYEAALTEYRTLLQTEPDNADYLLGQGQTLLWAGRPQQALEPLQRAARQAPDYREVALALAQARAAAQVPAVREAPLPTPPSRRRHALELSLRQEDLDSGAEDWLVQRLDYVSNRPEAITWYAAAIQERRFGDRDQGIELGTVLPLDARWALQLEAGLQFDPDFLPRGYADLRLQRLLPGGWIGAASYRRTEYETSRIDRLALSAERYWDRWRASYTLNLSHVQDAGDPLGHALVLSYFYQGLSYIGLRGSLGEEEGLERDGVITSRVTAIGLEGRHWFGPRWALSWSAGRLIQGDYYSRNGVMLGLRHAF